MAARCASCHSGCVPHLSACGSRPRKQIEARIDDIERQAVLTRTMPPGNATGMTDEERDLLAAWIAQSR